MKAFSATITGRVQGVGFRWRAMSSAQSLRISGWVRNNPDGSVAVWAEGEELELQQFLRWLRLGPPYAEVKVVTVSWSEPTGRYDGFIAY
jgi:acylphosphatase